MCRIDAVKGAKCVVVLLYRMQIWCGIAAVNGTNLVWDCCCKGSKLCLGLLLYSEQIGCGSAAVQGGNWLWDYW